LHLSVFQVGCLLIALAPELDLRYERLYAYLQDDVTRKRPSVDLALNLLCRDAADRLLRREDLTPESSVIRHRLLHLIPDPQQVQPPLLSHYLKLDDPILRFLLGQSAQLDSRLTPGCERLDSAKPFNALNVADHIRQGLEHLVDQAQSSGDVLKLYFQGLPGLGQRAAAEAIATAVNRPLLVVNLAQVLARNLEFESFLALLGREVQFQNAILYVEDWDVIRSSETALLHQTLLAFLGLLPLSQPRLALDVSLGELPEQEQEVPPPIILLAGQQRWETAGFDPIQPVVIPFAMPDTALRQTCWRLALKAAGLAMHPADLAVLGDRFRLTPEQISKAVAMAINQARWRKARKHNPDSVPVPELEESSSQLSAVERDGKHPSVAIPSPPPTTADLYAAARAQSGTVLANLARKLQPKYSLSDIVLPTDAKEQLIAICRQAKYRQLVFDQWGFDRKLSLGKGLNVLFSGPPGTGKTMAAEVIANELQLDLYKIDLSQVVSKYIGETEKNLDRIFTAAENANAILLFDEADALFGKRSEVKDAHDRYANIEIGYLLQKMEEFEGITILATNLRQNLDEAFVRRLAFVVPFPSPDEASRRRIWEMIWPAEMPLDPDIDFCSLAQRFKLSGGHIKNIALSAAFLAAETGGPVTMAHLLQATQREYQKMGKVMPEEAPDNC
jgi:AAA+ superfamily predicted ATPase